MATVVGLQIDKNMPHIIMEIGSGSDFKVLPTEKVVSDGILLKFESIEAAKGIVHEIESKKERADVT